MKQAQVLEQLRSKLAEEITSTKLRLLSGGAPTATEKLLLHECNDLLLVAFGVRQSTDIFTGLESITQMQASGRTNDLVTQVVTAIDCAEVILATARPQQIVKSLSKCDKLRSSFGKIQISK